jgi:hypothetical protein
MTLDVKMRLVLAGAVLGASLLALKAADAQVDPSTGSPTTLPGTPQTTPGVSPTLEPVPLEPLPDAGMGGSGPMMPPSIPSPFEEDAGLGGSGFSPPAYLSPPSILGGADAGTGLGY